VSKRKPFRRTAWSMLCGGVVVAGLMLGGGALVVSQGDPAGPGEQANWPAGADIAVFRRPGPQPEAARNDSSVACTVTLPDGRTIQEFADWNERLTPDFAGQAMITCEHQVMVLSGAKLTLARTLQSEWIVLPLFVAILGILFFFPRFTMVWASLTQPIGRWIRRRNS
jgi:hypothetical protein